MRRRVATGFSVVRGGQSGASHIGAQREGEPAFTNADLVTGRPPVPFFCPSNEESLSVLLTGFRDRGPDFAALDLDIFPVSRRPLEVNRVTHAALGLPVKLPTYDIGEILGTFDAEASPVGAIFDPNRRIACIQRSERPAALVGASVPRGTVRASALDPRADLEAALRLTARGQGEDRVVGAGTVSLVMA
jgi:hypothetical protein